MSSASSTETSVVTSTECPYRRTLKVAVCALAHDAGFAAADDVSLETLTEMLQSCEFSLSHTCTLSSVGGRKCFKANHCSILDVSYLG